MSYNKTNWKSGDVVTAEKLNKLENGVADANGGLPFISTGGSYSEGALYLDITPNDIFDENNNLIAIPIISVPMTDNGDRMYDIRIGCYAVFYSFNNSYLLKAIYGGTDNIIVNTFTAESRNDHFCMFSE